MSRRLLVAAAAAALLAAPARAQLPAPFALQTFEPAPAGDRFLAVPGTDVPAHLVPSAALVLAWAADPLVLRVDGEVLPGGRIVHRQFWAFAQGAVGWSGKVLLDASLPVALYQSGSRPIPDLPQVASTSLGDLKLGARMALPALGRFSTAGALRLWLPTGSKDAFASDGAPRVEAEGLASATFGPVETGASLGLLWRAGKDLGVTRTGAAVAYGLAAAWCAGPWRAGPELYGRFQFEGTATSPAEVLLAGHFRRGPFDASLALGTQLDRDPGAAPVRVLARIGWRPTGAPPPPPPAPPPPPPPAPPPPPPLPAPPPDRDGDGVPDAIDACPDVAGEPNLDPSRHGCPPPLAPAPLPVPIPTPRAELAPTPVVAAPEVKPPPLVQLTAEKIVILQSVLFETDRDVIRPESEPVLRAVAAVLTGHPELRKVVVEGHTDSQGGLEHNTVLSAQRARAVIRWLTGHGVAAGRLEAKGYGPTRPLDTNATPAGRARNRRVEFQIVETGAP